MPSARSTLPGCVPRLSQPSSISCQGLHEINGCKVTIFAGGAKIVIFKGQPSITTVTSLLETHHSSSPSTGADRPHTLSPLYVLKYLLSGLGTLCARPSRSSRASGGTRVRWPRWPRAWRRCPSTSSTRSTCKRAGARVERHQDGRPAHGRCAALAAAGRPL